jgi:hypothetical protein
MKTKCSSTDEWIKKMWHTNTMEYYSDREKHGILSFVTTLMDLESIVVK